MTDAAARPPEIPGRGSYLLVRRLFLSLLGVTFAIAFASLGVQADGLFGSRGIVPGCGFLDAVRDQYGTSALLELPSLFWLHCSDAAIHAACVLGVVSSLLLIVGLAPSVVLALAWLLYLSLVSIAGVFLGYQWDMLLIETAFVSILLAPRQLRPRDAWRSRVPRSALWLLRWLLFRLLFLSGLVKLLSGDPAWRSLTALQFHYFTQPIPAWTSWYAQQLPAPLQTASALLMFVIELVLPFAIFGPRRVRLAAFAGFLLLQSLIGLTGNYGFFNLLTVVLCVPLLDDAMLRRAVPARWRSRLPAVEESALAPPRRRARLVYAALTATIALFTVVSFAQRVGVRPEYPEPLSRVLRVATALRSFNAYGLFAVMTTRRPEILLEGSADGREWRTYEFRWKPGRLDRAPRFAQPHMPRLDWQMWFAALRSCRPWFQRFMLRLLEGSPPVSALLAHDPFPDAPPRYLRSTLYLYRFAPPGSDAWWEREEVGPYCGTVTRRGHLLERVDPSSLGVGPEPSSRAGAAVKPPEDHADVSE